MKAFMAAAFASVAVIGLVGCDEKSKEKASQSVKDAGKAMGDAGKAVGDAGKKLGDAAKTAWESVKAESVKTYESKLSQSRASLDEIKRKADQITDPAKRTAATPAVEAAGKAYDELAAKVEAIKSGSESTWESMKDAAATALQRFDDALDKARNLVNTK